ncbi:hypothetical protein C8R46DRAFT_1023658 [Mycena filopes]|nr:hypothetical protein C8R46DRAFT_1023658 [Mycena filopes]
MVALFEISTNSGNTQYDLMFLLLLHMQSRFLAQELVDSIADELRDSGTLKTFSLVSSVFRSASQRVLFRSLTLCSHVPPNGPRHQALFDDSPCQYSEAYTRLTEAPYLAKYVKQLRIRISKDVTAVHFETLAQILALLPSVERYTIRGHRTPWNNLPTALVDILSRQQLSELHLGGIINVPPMVFSYAPFLSFSGVKLGLNTLPPFYPPKDSIRDLVLHSLCDDIYTILARPEIAFAAALRSISTDPEHPCSEILIQRAARTLEHIHLSCRAIPGPVGPITPILPVLPNSKFHVLRRLELYISAVERPITALLDQISRILGSDNSPVLEWIVVSFGPSKSSFPLPPNARAMAELDAVLAAHKGGPSVVWRMFPVSSDAEHLQEAHLIFAVHIREGFPKAQKQGKLLLIHEDFEDVYREGWPIRCSYFFTILRTQITPVPTFSLIWG